MFEGVLLCALAFVLLAAASYKFRREAGISGERAVRALRSGAAVLIAASTPSRSGVNQAASVMSPTTAVAPVAVAFCAACALRTGATTS